MTDTLLIALALALAALALGLVTRRRRQRRRTAAVKAPAPRPGPAAARPAPPADPSERIRREIEERVHNLRRAREEAEHWVPPPVDAVSPRRGASAAPPDFADTSFADTTIPDDDPPPPPAKPARRG